MFNLSIKRGFRVRALYFSAFGLLFIHAMELLKDKRISLPSPGYVTFELLQKTTPV